MARLYFRGQTAHQFAITMRREGKLAGKRSLRHMRKVAKLVMEQSKRNAPVDWKGYSSIEPPGFELERSHRITEAYNGRRIEATVEVGGMVGSVNVDKYVDFIHIHEYNLGRGSIAKSNSDPRNRGGPRFLERALEDQDAEFNEWGEELLDDLIGAFGT